MIELTESENRTLTFLEDMAKDALDRKTNGDLSMLNHYAKRSTAFKYFVDNVATTKVMSREQFARQLPNLMTEAEILRQEYERSLKADENAARLTTIESELKALKNLLQESLAAKETTNEQPAKRGKKTAKQEVEATEETETTEGDEADGESEA